MSMNVFLGILVATNVSKMNQLELIESLPSLKSAEKLRKPKAIGFGYCTWLSRKVEYFELIIIIWSLASSYQIIAKLPDS